jgi:hypothetical protein
MLSEIWGIHDGSFQCYVDLQVEANVSEEHTASIFVAEDDGSMFLWNVTYLLPYTVLSVITEGKHW